MDPLIREMTSADLAAVAELHAAAFPRQTRSAEWIDANHRAFPRIRYFVAEHDETIIGYIAWMEKAGFRARAVLELEQLAVRADQRGRGIGGRLIRESLAEVRRRLAERGAQLKAILVTTRTDNEAQRLYADALGAKPVAVLADLYSADEVVMIARGPFE